MMNYRARICLLWGIALLLGVAYPVMAMTKLPPSIVFLNPGDSLNRGTGVFWQTTSRVMSIAAENLGLNLEILYAERNHLLMIEQAQAVAQRSELPDYLVITNQKQSAPQIMQLFSGTKTKILLMHNDLTVAQRNEIGNEREQIVNWIGTVTTDEESGAARMMEELYRQLGTGEPQILGITGGRGTPVSLERATGVSDFIKKSGYGQQLQLTFCDWSSLDAKHKTEVLLSRYPQANIIWAANYAMADGANQAVNQKGLNVLVGSVAIAPQLKSNITLDGIDVSLASHYFIGAWAMVLLYDYDNGADFRALGGVRQKLDYLLVINPDNVASYYQMVNENIDKLDFGIFSKYRHPSLEAYSFSLTSLMRDN
jgi:ABC-type sugar transport system substrate-binding protein